MVDIFKQIVFVLFLFVLLFFGETGLAEAQSHQHGELLNHPVLSLIETELKAGEITREQALLQSVYAGFAPDRLDAKYNNRTGTGDDLPIRCMTPVMMEFERVRDDLHPDIVEEIESLTSVRASADMHSHISPSGNFILYYDTEGRDAVPTEDLDESGVPDYIEKAAFAADSSYRYEVETIGFTDFLKTDPYEIYFFDFGFYGTTRSSGSTTTIQIHSNFENFPENSHPDGQQTGALYVTMAHEIKHAIQYATNRWKGDSGTTAWSEMDATLMEEIVFDDVNDYYNYIMRYDDNMNNWDRAKPHSSSIFGSPDDPTPGSYYHITWMLYFAESYGIDFWVDVWELIRLDYLDTEESENPLSFLDAVREVLDAERLILEQEHIINHLWHMTAGPDFTTPGFGFEERDSYPSTTFSEILSQPPDSVSNRFLRSHAAEYVEMLPSNITPGQPTILLDSDITGMGIGVVGFFKNGEIDVQFSVNPNSTSQSLQTIWSWNDLIDMRIAVVNTNRDSSGTYNLLVTSTIPEEDMITQNYPNPFNPVTTIEFSLTEQKDVSVEVYDRIGRKISTLVDGRLNRGFHTVTFNGSGLASGVYFYRIITDQTSITRKMVLVK